MEIQSRASWNARPPKTDPVRTDVVELFLHHSVGSGTRDKDGDGDMGDDYMRAMQDYHMDVKGWNDVAYNHAYDPDGGEFYEGRGWDIRPGAQYAHNTGTHALVIMGDFRTKAVTDQIKLDIARFYRDAIDAGRLPEVEVLGHRQAPNQSTTCPGDNMMNALPEINRLIMEDEMVDRNTKADDGQPVLADNFDEAVSLGIMSEHTQPGGVAFNDEFATFLKRAGVFEIADLKRRIADLEDQVGSAGGLTEAQVKAIVNGSQIVAPD